MNLALADKIILAILFFGLCVLITSIIRNRKDGKESLFQTIFKSNKDFDSSMTLGGIVLVYVALSITVAVVALTKDTVPQELGDVFQHAKELMLLVAGYFFRKGQEQLAQNNGGNRA